MPSRPRPFWRRRAGACALLDCEMAAAALCWAVRVARQVRARPRCGGGPGLVPALTSHGEKKIGDGLRPGEQPLLGRAGSASRQHQGAAQAQEGPSGDEEKGT